MKERHLSATHEAAHAVAVVLTGHLLYLARVSPDAEGYTVWMFREQKLDRSSRLGLLEGCLEIAACALAGFAAEVRLDPAARVSPADEISFGKAAAVAERLGVGRGTFRAAALEAASSLISQPQVWDCVMVIADELLVRDRLSGTEARDIVRRFINLKAGPDRRLGGERRS